MTPFAHPVLPARARKIVAAVAVVLGFSLPARADDMTLTETGA
jgi:hypothetical protein